MENRTVYCHTCLHLFNNTYKGLLTTFILAVVPANCWALWLMMSSCNFLTDKMDLLKFSLLVNDLVLGLALSLVFPGLYLFLQTTLYLWGFSIGLMMVGKPLIQCSLCLERYLAVLQPHTFLRYRPLRYRAAILALICLVITVFCCLEMALCGTLSEHIYVLDHFFAAEMLLLLLVDLFCCLCILNALHRQRVGDGGPGCDRLKQRAFNIVASVQVQMMCSYMPPILGRTIDYLLENDHYCLWNTMSACFILCSSCVYSLHKVWPDIQACVRRVRTAIKPAVCERSH